MDMDMDSAIGTTATRVSIWLAMLGYAASVTALWIPLVSPRWAFRCYIAGLGAFILHVIFAFDTYYDWSHTIAWLKTRDQTFEATGFNSGHGIYLNYALGIVWLTDAIRWKLTTHPLHQMNRGAAVCLHGFFLFMIINGGIAFASGAVRLFTALLLVVTLGAAASRMCQQVASH